jgi:hypothetical protein
MKPSTVSTVGSAILLLSGAAASSIKTARDKGNLAVYCPNGNTLYESDTDGRLTAMSGVMPTYFTLNKDDSVTVLCDSKPYTEDGKQMANIVAVRRQCLRLPVHSQSPT